MDVESSNNGLDVLPATDAVIETRETLKAVIINILNLNIARNQIKEQSNLFDLGIDSMTVVSLVIAIEEEFGVQLPENLLSAATFERVDNLTRLILEQKSNAQ